MSFNPASRLDFLLDFPMSESKAVPSQDSEERDLVDHEMYFVFQKEQKKEVSYQALTKFSFFESGEWWVKVHVPVEGVGELQTEI